MFITVPCTWIISLSLFQSVVINFDSLYQQITLWEKTDATIILGMRFQPRALPNITQCITDKAEPRIHISRSSWCSSHHTLLSSNAKDKNFYILGNTFSTIFSKMAKNTIIYMLKIIDCALTCSFFRSHKIKLRE